MHCSFESFEKIIDAGVLSGNLEGRAEIYLTPKKGLESSPFLNSYNIIILEQDLKRLPNRLGFIKPFLKVQKSIKESSEPFPNENLNLQLWNAIWNHLSVLYIYSANLSIKDPWEHSLKLSDAPDAFEDFDPKSFYDDFDLTTVGPLEYYLLTNFKFPEEYVQKALSGPAIAKHFNSEISRLFGEYENAGNQVDANLFEKVSKWAPHISKSNILDFIERAFDNWKNTRESIDQTRVVLTMVLFALEAFYSRLSIEDLIQQSHDFTSIVLKHKHQIKVHKRLTVALYFLYGRMLAEEGLRERIQFFPDYLKLVRTSSELYDHVSGSENVERWHDKGSVRLNSEYLNIGVDDKNKPDRYTLKIQAKNLNQMMHIPPYIFFEHIQSLIMCNVELMHFTEKHLGLDPGVMYGELKKAKENQLYDLKGSMVFEELIRRFESRVKNRLLSNKRKGG